MICSALHFSSSGPCSSAGWVKCGVLPALPVPLFSQEVHVCMGGYQLSKVPLDKVLTLLHGSHEMAAFV